MAERITPEVSTPDTGTTWAHGPWAIVLPFTAIETVVWISLPILPPACVCVYLPPSGITCENAAMSQTGASVTLGATEASVAPVAAAI